MMVPICRVEEGRFIPRYSLYIITYYSSDPQLSYAHRWKNWKQEHHFPPFVRTPIFSDSDQETWWDLVSWVKKGRLMWMDPDDPNLPLRTGPVESFPYVNIIGSRTSVTYRDGKSPTDW
ncbi:MAG: hypothetical protein GY832_44260 [Chloroflexi bacterium]|nr:hypothetical protein [Chloroflexota bacterium]